MVFLREISRTVSLGPVYVIPLSRDEMRGGIILMYGNKSRPTIEQCIIIF